MRDLLEDLFPVPGDPVTAARQGMRPVLRRRFYEHAGIGDSPPYAVVLDGKPIRTPARRALAAPSQHLAQALAAEWQAQGEVVDPLKMPLTRLANSVIDGVVDAPGAVAADIAKYLGSDLLCYRAREPARLVARQAAYWDPLLGWARTVLGAAFTCCQGVMHVAQSDEAVAAARASIPDEPWRLGALHAVTTLTGSALLALALWHGRISREQAWEAAHVDEDWNMELWGRDELALQRREFRHAEFLAAATILAALPPK